MLIVTYGANAGGYRVLVEQDGNVIDDYTAGNHPLDSQVYLPAYAKGRLSLNVIRQFARDTAAETALTHRTKSVVRDDSIADTLLLD